MSTLPHPEGATAPLSLRPGLAALPLPHFDMPAPTLRSRLLLLVLSSMAPALLGLAWVISSTYQAEAEAHGRLLRDMSRAMALVVDGELERRATIAHVLAQSAYLDGPLPLDAERRLAFERQARRAAQGVEGWVELRAPGRVLASTRQPEGTAATVEPRGPVALHQEAGMLALSSTGVPDETYAAWVAPVRRDGELLYNVAVTIRPSELQRLLEAQTDEPGMIATVIDSSGLVVARRPGGASYVGRSATQEMLARVRKGPEGPFVSISLDGTPINAYYRTSAQGWTYISAMHRESFTGRLPSQVERIITGAALLLALAVLATLWTARRIERPFSALKTAARDMQAGRQVDAARSGMAEFDDVSDAMSAASRAMAEARGELELSVEQAVARTRMVEQRGAQSQRVEALGRLTGGVAHEFNNLLGIISNSMHLLQRHPAAAELQAPLAATQRAVDKGSQLTQHLLRFAGRRPVRIQVLSFTRYLPEVQDLMRSVLGRRIEIRVQVAPDVRPVRLDANELDLALVNLALNAHDAMPNGGELRLRAANATPADLEGLALPPGDYVMLTVGDDGVGLDPAVLERAFEPFFTTKAVGLGSGLGLSQVWGFATQAGGAARLASTPGLGTTVSLLLPVAAERTTPATRHADTGAPCSIAGMTVLLVEDDEALGEITATLLAAHGARVLRANRGDSALRLLEAGAQPDIVLSDVVMPGQLDGVALARQLRERYPELPVVLISGFNNTPMSDGEFTVLRKPCPPAQLLATLETALATA